MRLAGHDPDNSNADMRANVIHGAWYAEPSLIATQGKLGRSEGCFVFGEELLPQILYKLGPGRLLFADRLSVPPPQPVLPPLPGTENIVRTRAMSGECRGRRTDPPPVRHRSDRANIYPPPPLFRRFTLTTPG